MKTLIGIILLATSVAFAQDAPKPKAEPKTPVLTADQKLEFFKAQAEYQTAASQEQQASQAAQQKQKALQDTVKIITNACGKEFVPSIDPKGYPVCVAKPAPEAKK